jgi:hypothetical protein
MGRKSLKEESLMASVINMSWRTISDVLNSPTVSKKRKQEISLEIVKKSCPRDIHLGGQDQPITIIWRSNGQDFRPTSGPVDSVDGQEQVPGTGGGAQVGQDNDSS